MVAFPAGSLAVVVGASGGIGAAIADRLETDDRFSEVVRLSRSSQPPVELTSEKSIAAAADEIAAKARDLRLVVDATGFLHGDGFAPEKALNQIDPDHLQRSFAVNAIGPALLMKHFLPLLPVVGKSVFATLSARVGSIGDNQLGGWYSYRASKAALNQLVRTASIELKRRRPHAICVALHPGTVDTDLSAPFARTGLNVRSPTEAAAALLKTIEQLRAEDSGSFLDYKGEPIVW